MRYGLHRNELYDWRGEFGTVAVWNAIAEADAQGPDFIPVVADAGVGRVSLRRRPLDAETSDSDRGDYYCADGGVIKAGGGESGHSLLTIVTGLGLNA